MNLLQVYDCINRINEADFNAADSLLRRSLPENEIRSKEGQRALLDNAAYHLSIQKDEKDAIIAMLATWDFPEFVFGEHLAVDEGLRNSGIGSKILDSLLNSLSKPLVIEVELPNTELAARRIKFYERHGLHLNPYEYFQPPLQPQHACLPLSLMTYPAPLSNAEFLAVRKTLYRDVYRFEDQTECYTR